jgi:hypothetical protein
VAALGCNGVRLIENFKVTWRAIGGIINRRIYTVAVIQRRHAPNFSIPAEGFLYVMNQEFAFGCFY